jgi:hypothetical protein
VALEGLARLAAAHGEEPTAHDLADEASRVRAASGRPAPPHERCDMADLLAGHPGRRPAGVDGRQL